MLHFLRNEVILSDFPFLGLSSLCKKERKNFSWCVYFALKFPSFPSILQRWEGTQRCYLKRYGKPTIRANAWKLNREDGKEEMTLAFLEILESMNLEKLRSREDGVIVSYFKNALRHAYCHKVEESIKQPSVAFSIDNTEEQEREAVLAQDGWNTAGKDRYFFTLFEGCSELTEKGFDADLLRRVQRHGDRGSLGDEQAERQPDQAAWVGEAEKVIAGRIFLKSWLRFSMDVVLIV